MNNQAEIRTGSKRLVTTKTLFTITILVAVITIIGIWLFGLGQKRTIFENSMFSTSILSSAFFLFLAIGLYQGIKLRDNLGQIIDKVKPLRISGIADFWNGFEILQFGELIGGTIAWLIAALMILLFLWLFGFAVWASITVFVAMLYWIFFRALRLVFKNSNKCKGNLSASFAYGLGYTILYNFWIYGIILISHYVIK